MTYDRQSEHDLGLDPADPRAPRIERLRRLSWWLDQALIVPGTGWRFGFDGLIGLVPVVGDLAGTALGAWIVWEAHQLGATRGILLRMGGNLLLDAALGSIPLLGDLADFGFKANRRNLRLLHRHLSRSRRQ
jgi:hypothetical protein